MKNTLIVIIVGVVLIGGIAGFMYSQKDADVQVPVGTTIPVPGASTDVDETIVGGSGDSLNTENQGMVVTYTDQGFSPKSVTVPKNTTIVFTNNSTHRMWVATAMHPTHEVYDGTTTSEHCADGVVTNGTFDQCQAVDAGASWSYTFSKVGSWNYHNHSRSSDFGSVVVTP